MAPASSKPVPRPGILDIAAYVPGTHAVAGHENVHRLSSNESPLGASPKALDALKNAMQNPELYPDGSGTLVRNAIAERYGLNPDRIVCGAGSDELLELLARGYLEPGDEAIYTAHGFLVYRIAIMAASATPVVAPEKDFTANVDAILAAVTEKTRIVFLANPNNPTGTYISMADVRRLHAGLPGRAILVLDAAYAEYVRRNDYESGIELVSQNDNVVMTRTFSKIHGLAGLRLGWLYGPPEIVDVLNRIRGPFNINAPAIAAGSAAIADQEFVEQAVSHNNEWLPWVSEHLTALGLTVTPSVGNFILVHFPDEEGYRAKDADLFLLDRGIILRRVAGYGLPHGLRMTIGTEAANRAVVAALTEFMGGRPT